MMWQFKKPCATRRCIGHTTKKGGHVDCDKDRPDHHLALRCKRCDKAEKSFRSGEYYRRWKEKKRKENPSQGRPQSVMADRKAVIVCRACINLPHRRPPGGCKRCGLPWAPDAPLQQHSVLQSSSGMAVGR